MGQVVDLDPWLHPFVGAVFPLFFTRDEVIRPVGTAWCLSNLPLVASALHCILGTLREDDRFAPLLRREPLPPIQLGDLGLCLLHHQPRDNGDHLITTWGMHGAQAKPNTDIVYGQPQIIEGIPFCHLKVSFDPPRIGSAVRCVGFHSIEPREGFDTGAIKRGETRMIDVYSHKLSVAVGEVRALFVERFSNGYCEAPCFLVDAPVAAGMSGGPVFNEAGNVCGVISASMTDPKTGAPSALVSMLYPSILTEIKMRADFGPNFSITGDQFILGMIGTKNITTDGSEERVHFVQVDGDGSRFDHFAIGPVVHRDDAAHVFRDVRDYEESRPAQPEERRGYLYRRRES